MAFHEDFVWEVRTTGDDTNGGGYKSSAGTTDYSQQNAAELTLTDCATSGTGSTTLTSASGGFTAAMVGNVICLSAGTNLTIGWYEITGYTDSNTVTLDRAPDDGVGGVSSATGKVGGCLASPGVMSTVAAGNIGMKNTCYIKSGTYQISSTAAGSNGRVSVNGITFIGYENTRDDLVNGGEFSSARPLLQATVSNISYILGGASVYSYIRIDGGGPTLTGNRGSSAYINAYVEAVGVTDGFAGTSQLSTGCFASGYGTGTGFSSVRSSSHCAATNFRDGWANNTVGVSYSHCIAYNNSRYGFYGNEGGSYGHYCVAYSNGSYGFSSFDGSNDPNLVRCITANNGDYGIRGNSRSGRYMIICQTADYGNTNGRILAYANTIDSLPISLTADPFIDGANGDFRLNDTAGGGAVLKGFGVNPLEYSFGEINALRLRPVATPHPLAYN